jgi:hypothetical protein
MDRQALAQPTAGLPGRYDHQAPGEVEGIRPRPAAGQKLDRTGNEHSVPPEPVAADVHRGGKHSAQPNAPMRDDSTLKPLERSDALR